MVKKGRKEVTESMAGGRKRPDFTAAVLAGAWAAALVLLLLG